MAALVRDHHWASTPLGPEATWPTSLRALVSMVLANSFPMNIFWGPDLIQIYNDGYRPILGDKHPASLGAPGGEIWAEVWHVLGPLVDGIRAGGPASFNEHLRLDVLRRGFREETYFTFSYSPVPDDTGALGGILITVVETTAQVLSERRMRTLQALASGASPARTIGEACTRAADALAQNLEDLPFVRLYILGDDGKSATLAAATGAPPEATDSLPDVDLSRADPWELGVIVGSGRPRLLTGLPPTLGAGVAQSALLVPIVEPAASRPSGVLVAGLSPHLIFDEKYRSFVDLVASQLATSLGAVRTLEEARRRADVLAELNRAKTTFFSNVSHEFRTPLTLMLGPTEEALAAGRALGGADLERVHRNELRLLRLVNALLDFSRIEAGRLRARFQPTDLAAYTADVVSGFRSLVEKAGLRLEVDVPTEMPPVHVDRELWEKVVLNLVSNAFKFTFTGGIRVGLAQQDGQVRLTVSDSGVGIPASELGQVFERFHRVEGARGRSYEGSGIGLALVKELVELHGGSVAVDSREGAGSAFTVSVPLGTAHLPRDQVAEGDGASEPTTAARQFVEEAAQWLGDDDVAAPTEPTPGAGRVLLVEDNADMRRYIQRLLGEQGWLVDAVGDGQAALARVREQPPDLVITDVMMPVLDGFGLLRELRADPQLRLLPVIMLSARAGEEMRTDSLSAGADDYLVKPFSARELTARVRIHLELGASRRRFEEQRRYLDQVLQQAPGIIAVLRGPDHVFDIANPPYLEAIGHRDIIGKPIRQALPELHRQRYIDILDEVYRTGVPYVGTEAKVHLDRGPEGGEDGYFTFVYQPMRGAAGEITGVLVFAFDVTGQVNARREVERLMEELKLADQRKDEFLATLAHELRNPMAAISMALSLLDRMEGDPARERRLRETARRQMGNLVRLVDDLLDVSRITRGAIELRKEEADLAAVVQGAVAAIRPGIEGRDHELSVTVAPGSYRIDADVTRLEQVITNLLNNAAKYTPPGGRIQVHLGRHDGEAVLSVRDTGRGIPAAMLERIFEMFVQVDQTIDRAAGGLGLGLTLVKRLVEMHGGNVVACSAGEGQGSELVVRLPMAEREPRVVAEPAHAHVLAAERRRILVVEDSDDIRETLRTYLEALGHEVLVARSGAEGVARLDEQPDVALVDIGLPEMDGYEVARRARAAPGGDRLYLVAITGYGGPEARAQAERAGFDLHLTKPVNVSELPQVVSRMRSRLN